MNSQLDLLLSEGIIDDVLGRLKSGKEAEVFRVVYRGQIVAAKVYKDRQQRSFQHNVAYKEGRKVRNSRTQRAIDKGSRFGRDEAEDAWKASESSTLQLLHRQGVRVPTPVLFYEGVLLMELVSDADGDIAPRLIEAAIEPEQAAALYRDLRGQMIKVLCCDLIHGDLSPYNVLLGAAGPTIIDFPQAISAAHNSQSEGFFHRDFENILNFFLSHDRRLAAHRGDGREIWRAYARRDLSPDYVPPTRAPAPPPRAPQGYGDQRPRFNDPRGGGQRFHEPRQGDQRQRGPWPGDGQNRAQQPSDGQYRGQQPSDGQYRGQQPSDGQYRGQQSRDGQHRGQQPSDGQYRGQQSSDGQYRGQQSRDGQQRGQQPSDGQYRGQQSSDGQYRGQRPNDGQYRGQRPNDGQQRGQRPDQQPYGAQQPGGQRSEEQRPNERGSSEQRPGDQRRGGQHQGGQRQGGQHQGGQRQGGQRYDDSLSHGQRPEGQPARGQRPNEPPAAAPHPQEPVVEAARMPEWPSRPRVYEPPPSGARPSGGRNEPRSPDANPRGPRARSRRG